MKITLIGYGKMGRTVERIAREQGHEIVCTLDLGENPGAEGYSGEWVQKTDVLIDFSVAAVVPQNVENAAKASLPIIVGTTGWYDKLDEVRRSVERYQGACVYSSNFSLGVQILFHLVREAGRFFSRFPDFSPFVLESHHGQKVDAPSGTALTLLNKLKESYHTAIPVASLRAGFFPGTHVVGFDSAVDTVKLEHTARNRDGFAHGALVAAGWITGKKGFFTFEEVIFGNSSS
ncbi:MAG: dihydrodipicolinate reductase [Acidobacteria bacterium]|nr:dihydrodipicolinate reductase [Acidobacteriota bacterium]